MTRFLPAKESDQNECLMINSSETNQKSLDVLAKGAKIAASFGCREMEAVLTKMAVLKSQMTKSALLSEHIAKLIPGGVNSPFRSFNDVGGHTVFFERALGSRLFDIDGKSYIDYVGAWGPAVLGHCHPEVVEACISALKLGPVFGAPHELELELAIALVSAIPSLEQLRFVNSGTEAVMSAVRLSRGYTGRDKIIIFEGCYHGHSDAVLASQTHSASAGIPQSYSANTLVVEFNNLSALEECLEAHKGDVAAVLIEPIAGAMGVVAPQQGYLEGLRQLCTTYGAVLIFDEVLTGFRISRGGAQEFYNVKPDLSCFGKALAGGMPIGAYGGSSEIMSRLAPIGKVYQAGTFSGNPVTMAGAIQTLKLLADPQVFVRLERSASRLFAGLTPVIEELSLPVQLQRVGSMFSISFTSVPIRNFKDSAHVDTKAYARFFHYLLEHGIYMPPTAVDAACISWAHNDTDIDQSIEVCKAALRQSSDV